MGRGKFHDIERPGQEGDINELFTDLYRRLCVLEGYLVTKGDLLVFGPDGLRRIALGTEGQVLTVREGTDAGMAWETRAPAGGTGQENGGLRFWVDGQPWGVI